jgi:hypothetical protein
VSKILISADGSFVSFVYADDLRGILKQGVADIKRASTVEPDASGGWSADLSPVFGPILGSFETRSEALSAEVNWLENNRLI